MANTVTKQVTYTSEDLDTPETTAAARRVAFVLEADRPISDLVVQGQVVVNGEAVQRTKAAVDLAGLTSPEKLTLRDLLKKVYVELRDEAIAAKPGTPV